MVVTRTSQFTGEVHHKELNVTDAQLQLYADGRVKLQNCFPQLSPADRDFIKFGCTEEEWDAIFGEEE
jgi:hypothetical protein